MKRTHKFKALTNVQAIVAAAPSLSEAARQLGVHRSSVSRWARAGKVPRVGGRPVSLSAVAAKAGQSPEAWARVVRQRYILTATEQQLLDLAVIALGLSRDEARTPALQLAGMARYQALIKQLDLEVEQHGEAETAPDMRQWPRRA